LTFTRREQDIIAFPHDESERPHVSLGDEEVRAVEPQDRAGGARSRAWARANSPWNGQAEVMATVILRTETVTRAPSLSSLRRMVPQVAWASSV
jgi:hypothetical protein